VNPEFCGGLGLEHSIYRSSNLHDPLLSICVGCLQWSSHTIQPSVNVCPGLGADVLSPGHLLVAAGQCGQTARGGRIGAFLGAALCLFIQAIRAGVVVVDRPGGPAVGLAAIAFDGGFLKTAPTDFAGAYG